MELLSGHLDHEVVKAKSAALNPALLGKVLGIVPHRNETGHKPATTNQLIKRDQELRTRFEHAVDTLQELITATRFLRI